MPQAQDTDAVGFYIEFTKRKSIVRPGELIEGRIFLRTTTEHAIGSVSINFYGRSKVKIVQNNGQNEVNYRSRANLFTIEQQLYSSPYTFKPGLYDWPFSIQAPYIPDANLDGAVFRPREPFRTTDDDTLSHPMPPPVTYYHGSWGKTAYAFVEYVLEATLKEPPGLHKIRAPKTKKSIRIINFQPYPNPYPITDYNFVSLSQVMTARTTKLLPQDGGARPTKSRSSISSLMKRVTEDVSLPGCSFKVNVRFPTTLQVLHPDTVPFYLSVTSVPNPSSTAELTPTTTNESNLSKTKSTGALSPTPSAITPPSHIILKTFTLTLNATTTVRAPQMAGDMLDRMTLPIELSDASEILDYKIPVKSQQASPPSTPGPSSSSTTAAATSNYNDPPPFVPSQSTQLFQRDSKRRPLESNGEDDGALPPPPSYQSAELNLGHLLSMRLLGAQFSNIMSEWPLVPTFSTYNIARYFDLSYVLEFAVLDKTVKVSSMKEIPVTVVPGPELPEGWEDLGLTEEERAEREAEREKERIKTDKKKGKMKADDGGGKSGGGGGGLLGRLKRGTSASGSSSGPTVTSTTMLPTTTAGGIVSSTTILGPPPSVDFNTNGSLSDNMNRMNLQDHQQQLNATPAPSYRPRTKAEEAAEDRRLARVEEAASSGLPAYSPSGSNPPIPLPATAVNGPPPQSLESLAPTVAGASSTTATTNNNPASGNVNAAAAATRSTTTMRRHVEDDHDKIGEGTDELPKYEA